MKTTSSPYFSSSLLSHGKDTRARKNKSVCVLAFAMSFPRDSINSRGQTSTARSLMKSQATAVCTLTCIVLRSTIAMLLRVQNASVAMVTLPSGSSGGGDEWRGWPGYNSIVYNKEIIPGKATRHVDQQQENTLILMWGWDRNWLSEGYRNPNTKKTENRRNKRIIIFICGKFDVSPHK